MKAIFYLLILTLFKSIAYSQPQEYVLTNISTKEGLPSNESYYVFKDSKKYIWIATDNGVVRYDGSKFIKYDLPDNVIFKIREDPTGKVWFFSHSGKLSYFENEKIYPYKHNNVIQANIHTLLIIDAQVSREQDIYISGVYKNYIIYKDGKLKEIKSGYEAHGDTCIYDITSTNNENCYVVQRINFQSDSIHINVTIKDKLVKYCVPGKVNSNSFFGATKTHTGIVYTFLNNNLIKLNPDGTFKKIIFFHGIYSVKLTSEGNLWVGLSKFGCRLFSPNLELMDSIIQLANKSITSIETDVTGGVFFSTLQNGIYHLKSTSLQKFRLLGISSDYTSHVLATSTTSFLYSNENGIYKWESGISQSLKLYANRFIRDIQIVNNQLLVGGTYANPGQKIFIQKQSNKNNFYNKISFLDATNQFAFHNDSFVFVNYGISLLNYKLNKKDIYNLETNKELNFKPSFFFQDREQNIWLGAINGLYILKKGERVVKQVKTASGLFLNGATSMCELYNGIKCIALRFGGIALFQNNKLLYKFTEQNGLSTNAIKSLYAHGNTIWAVSNKGLTKIHIQSADPFTGHIENYETNIGLENQLIHHLDFFGNKLLLATNTGIYSLDTVLISKKYDDQQLPFYFNTISYSNKDTIGVKLITLPHTNPGVEINYSAISFDAGREIIYYYRFKNLDTNWIKNDGNKLALRNLAPGFYQLEMKAELKRYERCSEILSLSIRIKAPWWQNIFFISGILLLTLFLIYAFYKKNIERIKKQEIQKRDIQIKMFELEQTALRSQINPHFIFNCLTSIQQLIITDKNAEANDYLIQFSSLIRKTLYFSDKTFVSVADEIDYLQDYLELEQLRLPEQFRFHFIIDPAIDKLLTLIPHMVLQPLLENAVRHGLKPLKEKSGELSIILKKQNDIICCSVIDNGVGIKASSNKYRGSEKHQSVGLKLVEDRLNVLGEALKKTFTLKVSNHMDKHGNIIGVQAFVELPFQSSAS